MTPPKEPKVPKILLSATNRLHVSRGRLRQRFRNETQPLTEVEVSSEPDDETRGMLRSLGYL